MDVVLDRRLNGETPASANSLLSVADVATRMGVSRQTVHDWIRRSHLTVVETDDGLIRIRHTEVKRLEGLRRIAGESNMRLSTVRLWVDDGESQETSGSF
jgi:excisionase family DNA binding protein